jgi:hypothetical protein
MVEAQGEVSVRWDLSSLFPLPLGLVCPECGGTLIRASSWKFAKREEIECDVAFRCLECCLWWDYLLPVSEQLHNWHRSHGRTYWRWQDVMTTLSRENTTLFPNLSPDEVLEVVSAHWDMTGKFPTPKWLVACPSCRETRVQAQFWRFSRYVSHGGSNPYRCNVSMKCTYCSYVMMFGVFIPKEMYDYHIQAGVKSYHWREVRRLMEASNGSRQV